MAPLTLMHFSKSGSAWESWISGFVAKSTEAVGKSSNGGSRQSEIARNNTVGDCETQLGVTFPRLEKPRASQIVGGREIIDAEFRRISDEAYMFLSSAFRNQVEALKLQ